MNDNEIIKHLQDYAGVPSQTGLIASVALKFINRQKAEIEKLKTQLGKSENFFTIKLDKEQLNDIVKSQLEKFEVDATEVVRCKDCINRNTGDCAMYYQCNCGEQHTWESDNDYCSWGERKTEDADD